MSPRLADFGYIGATIALTAYAQLVLKWRMARFGDLPPEWPGKLAFLASLVLDPLILTALVASGLAWLTWMAALVRLDLGAAYSLLSLSYVVILLLSVWLLHEPLNAYKLAGVALIMIGTYLTTRV